MSVIKKKPYIEKIYESLTDEQKSLLQTQINLSGNAIENKTISQVQNGIHTYLLKLNEFLVQPCICIYTDTYCVALGYGNNQVINIYKLNCEKGLYTEIKEHCTIEELRRIVFGGSGGGSGEPLAYLKTIVKDDVNKEISVTDKNDNVTKFPYGGGGEPESYLKSVTKDTVNQKIVLKDQDNVETEFPYGASGEPDAYLKSITKDTVNKKIVVKDKDNVETEFPYENNNKTDGIELKDKFSESVSQTATTQQGANREFVDKLDEHDDRISNLEALGRFLSLWNCETGKPNTDPSTLPYTYQTGDYYIVGNVSSGTNYKPSGSSYTGAASTAVETQEVHTNDTYLYDGTNWILQTAGSQTLTAAQLAALMQGSEEVSVDLNAAATKVVTSLHAKKVEISAPSTATSGTITEEQLAALKESKNSYIIFNNEKYYLNDDGHVTGSLGYTHIGIENNVANIKNITITESTLSWVLTVISSGAGVQPTSDPYKVYGTDASGAQKNYTLDTDNLVGSHDHIPSSWLVMNSLDAKLDRNSTANVLYSNNNDGIPSLRLIDENELHDNSSYIPTSNVVLAKTDSIEEKIDSAASSTDKLIPESKIDEKINTEIADIKSKMDSSASSTNKVLAESTIDEKIESVEARQLYKTASQGSFATKAELNAATTFYKADGTSTTPTLNDVAYVLADEDHSGHLSKYTVAGVDPLVWGFVISISGMSFTQRQLDAINSGITENDVDNYEEHIHDTNNPHAIVKSQVGLGNVDNTSDLNKPISTATQTALNKKVDIAQGTSNVNKILQVNSQGNLALANLNVNGFRGDIESLDDLPNDIKKGDWFRLSKDNVTYVEPHTSLIGHTWTINKSSVVGSLNDVAYWITYTSSGTEYNRIQMVPNQAVYLWNTLTSIRHSLYLTSSQAWQRDSLTFSTDERDGYTADLITWLEKYGTIDWKTETLRANVCIVAQKDNPEHRLDNINLSLLHTEDINTKVDKTTTVNGHALSSNVTVTKGDVGLGNVDNTSDANKPISTATQNALNNKVSKVTDANKVYGTSSTGSATTWAVESTLSNYDRIPTSKAVTAALDLRLKKESNRQSGMTRITMGQAGTGLYTYVQWAADDSPTGSTTSSFSVLVINRSDNSWTSIIALAHNQWDIYITWVNLGADPITPNAWKKLPGQAL